MTLLAATAATAMLPAGCSRSGVLVAPSGHQRLTARDPRSGITVVLTTGVWEGLPANLEEDLTVIHAVVANGSRKGAIVLAPGDLELRDLRGFRYSLLDLGATFHLAGSDPSKGYGRSYRHDYDLGRAKHFQTIRATGDLAHNALPWGVLEPQTQMRGYLYFEPVHRTGNGAALTWHFASPQRSALVDLRFDFLVARA
jgi:hypothetical protein